MHFSKSLTSIATDWPLRIPIELVIQHEIRSAAKIKHPPLPCTACGVIAFSIAQPLLPQMGSFLPQA